MSVETRLDSETDLAKVQLTTKYYEARFSVKTKTAWSVYLGNPIKLQFKPVFTTSLSRESHSCGPHEDLDCFTVWDQVWGEGGGRGDGVARSTCSALKLSVWKGNTRRFWKYNLVTIHNNHLSLVLPTTETSTLLNSQCDNIALKCPNIGRNLPRSTN